MKPRSAKRSTRARVDDTAELRARLREAETRLRALEERHELTMGAIRESVYDWDIARGAFSVSKSMQAMLGLPPEQLSLEAWQQRVHPDDFPRFRDATIAHLKGETERFECDYRYRAGDGAWRWARTHGLAIRDKQGRAVRMVGSTGDITELKEREQQLAEQRAILETTLENIDQGITMVDKNLRTIALNRRFLELLGFPPERFARGFQMEEAFRFNAERGEYGPGDVEEQVRSRLELARRFEPHAFERTRPDGAVIAIRGKPLPDGGFVSTYTDVTDQRRTQEVLKKSEERYALATSAATEGIYEWNLETATLFLTQRAKAFFSFPSEELTPAAWNARVHAEDYPGYRAAIVDHFKGRSPHLEHEYRIADRQGAYKWVLDRGIGVRNAAGRVTKMIGALSDVTQRKRAELELRRARDEATDALERQTAVSEILRIIASSPADVLPMLDAVAERAVKLCESAEAAIFLPEAGRLRFAAGCQTGQTFQPGETIAITRGSVVARAFLDRDTVHVEDLAAAAPEEFEQALAYQRRFGHRSILAVPLLREGRSIGVIALWRFEVRAFALEHIALVRTFADQAAIAIENVRLFNETKEALHRQTVTAEILKVIASSPSDVQPVFDSIVKHAGRLAGGCSVNVSRLARR